MQGQPLLQIIVCSSPCSTWLILLCQSCQLLLFDFSKQSRRSIYISASVAAGALQSQKHIAQHPRCSSNAGLFVAQVTPFCKPEDVFVPCIQGGSESLAIIGPEGARAAPCRGQVHAQHLQTSQDIGKANKTEGQDENYGTEHTQEVHKGGGQVTTQGQEAGLGLEGCSWQQRHSRQQDGQEDLAGIKRWNSDQGAQATTLLTKLWMDHGKLDPEVRPWVGHACDEAGQPVNELCYFDNFFRRYNKASATGVPACGIASSLQDFLGNTQLIQLLIQFAQIQALLDKEAIGQHRRRLEAENAALQASLRYAMHNLTIHHDAVDSPSNTLLVVNFQSNTHRPRAACVGA